MQAMGKERYAELLAHKNFALAAPFKQEYTDLLKQYYYIGGMPEAVQCFIDTKDFQAVREIQERLLTAYEQDFSKHAPHEIVPRIRMVWQSIPSQLARENKKFLYGIVREGARAKDFEMALLWLQDCGLIHQVRRATAPSIPLQAYEDLRAFKLFFLDIGLLSCMVRLNPSTLLDGNALFKEFKGALTEQYVLQQLKTMPHIHTCYWTNDRGNAEIDFLLDTGQKIIPVDVKAEINLMAKSLKIYCEKFIPALAIRTSMADYKQRAALLDLPLWAFHALPAYFV